MLTSITVRPAADPPLEAYLVDDENILELASILGGVVTYAVADGTDHESHAIKIPGHKATMGIGFVAFPGDYIVRDVIRGGSEKSRAEQFARAFRPIGDNSVDLEQALRAESEDATAAVVLYDTPAGVAAFPVYGVHSAAHLVGLCGIIAGRIGHGA